MDLKPNLLLGGGIVVTILVGSIFVWSGMHGALIEETSARHDGQRLYADNCAACHGVNQEGQSNWQIRKVDGRLPAPPHDPSGHTWHHPDQHLFQMTKYGIQAFAGPGYETDMPAFQDILSDGEITAVLEYIKSTWPENIRREQERRTKSASLS